MGDIQQVSALELESESESESIPASDTLTATDGAGVTPAVITRAVLWVRDCRWIGSN